MSTGAPSARLDIGDVDRWSVLTTALAAALVGLGLWLGWRGVDLPAQLYRVAVARSHGLTLWDSQWYGGHWTLNYSVLFPVTAAFVGVGALCVVCAAAAALAFDRLVVGLLGRSARLGSAVFAVSVIVETSIGQLAFFCGEALALWCVVAATRRRWWIAGVLAATSSLASPLAGAFTALVLFAWWVATMVGPPARSYLQGVPLRLLGVAAGAVIPIVAAAALFSGQGAMPYPMVDWGWELAIALALWMLTPYALRVIRVAIVVYAMTATLCVLVPSPLGGNVGRLEDCLALPLAVVVCANRDSGGRPLDGFRRLGSHPRAVLAIVAIPLAVSQWSPAWAAITENPALPSTHRAFYVPLVAWLDHQSGPLARVEVVPTADHWEAAYVAPSVPLARGWERQLDVADNPIFYTPGTLDDASYRNWLQTNGVRFVALAAAPLDFAGTGEARLVESGVPGLAMVFHDANWRVYQLHGSEGIVTGAARLTSMDGGHLSLVVVRAGPILLRVRYSENWQVAKGDATVSQSPGNWMTVVARRPGVLQLDIHI